MQTRLFLLVATVVLLLHNYFHLIGIYRYIILLSIVTDQNQTYHGKHTRQQSTFSSGVPMQVSQKTNFAKSITYPRTTNYRSCWIQPTRKLIMRSSGCTPKQDVLLKKTNWTLPFIFHHFLKFYANQYDTDSMFLSGENSIIRSVNCSNSDLIFSAQKLAELGPVVIVRCFHANNHNQTPTQR